MGAIKFFSSSSLDKPQCNCGASTEEQIYMDAMGTQRGNPDPSNFKISTSSQMENYVILTVIYPECKNFEGTKILVFKDTTITELKNQKLIDPHFTENKKYHSPIARFEPTTEGWNNAILFVRAILINQIIKEV